MINAYEIAVSALLEDNVSTALMRIVEWSDKASASMLDFTENVRKASRSTSSLAKSFDRVATAATALGESNSALTRASYLLDTMVASSADVAKNMATARAEIAGIRGVGGGAGGGAGSGAAVAASAGASGRGHGHIGAATGVAAGGTLFGAYENARLTDLNVKSVATSQLPFDEWQPVIANLREREMAYAGKYAWATGGHIQPFGESMLEGSRLLRTLSAAKQKQMMDFAMPYMALEAKLKGVSMMESTDAFIGLAHMAGAYDPKQAQPLFESMLQASLTSHASLSQIARAASYSLPALHAAGANSSDVMLLVATMMQGGIMNTKSGTWLNAMAGNTLPNTLGSGMFSNKKQNEALHALGLYKGNKSQFYAHGSMDLMKIVGILAADREKIEPLKFNALLKMAFGTQGQRGASFFSEATTLGNLHALAALKDVSQPPMDIGRTIGQVSTVSLADQTVANANITLMNGTATLMGPVNAALSGASSFFGWTAKYSKDHPIMGGAMDAGLLFGGAVAGLGAWKGAKGAVGWSEKAIVGLSKYLGNEAGSLISRAVFSLSGEAISATIGTSVALTSAITAGIGYAIASAMTAVTSKLPAEMQTTLTEGIAAESGQTGGQFGYGVTAPPKAADTSHVQVNVHLDGHQIAAHVEKKLVPSKSVGPSGFNGDAIPYSPMMGMAP